MSDAINEFRAAMADAGLRMSDEISADGKLHRFHVNGDTKGKENGWYVLHMDGLPAGSFGSWKTGIKEKWCAKSSNELTPIERKELNKKVAEQKRQRDDEQQRVYKEAAERAQSIWDSAAAVTEHDYLRRKGIRPLGVRVSRDKLVVPLRSADGSIRSLQFIDADGSKRFLSGGLVDGCYTALKGDSTDTICICEGYATGVTIYDATKYSVVVAFNAGNLKAVALEIRKKYSDATIIVCADNDKWTDGNPGLTKATEAASAVDGLLAVAPAWEASDGNKTDFNDLAQLEDLERVKEIIDSALPQECEQEPEQEFKAPLEPPRKTEAEILKEYPSKANGFFDEIVKTNKKGEETISYKPNYDDMGRYFGNELSLATSKSFSYIFDEDYYRPIDDLEIKTMVDDLTLKECGPREVADFTSAVIYKCFEPQEFFKAQDGFINLKNGVLDINSRELRPRDRSLFFKYVLPHNYDPKAECPRWLEFLDFVFEGNKELADLSAEIFGYALCGGTPWLHKAFLLDGSGRNGKSTYLDVLKHLMGKDNYCSIPLRNLDKPFSVVMADGKLANIVGELEARDVNSEAFKIAVGGEELTAARKGKDEYQLPFTAKMFFATNNPPVSKDNSEGWYEKLCTIPFRRYIQPHERDASITAKLLKELPGVLNWSLDGLERLKQRGRLPDILAIDETLAEYRSVNDGVYDWVKEHVAVSEESNSYVIGNFYQHYSDWCKKEGRFPKSKRWFGRDVVRELKHVVTNMTITHPKNKTQCSGSFKITATSEFGWPIT